MMNLEDEVRDGYTVPAAMKRVWAVQLTMVRKVLEVCKRHNLKIWADGGTLLGTIRHRGYIPWDDDIDLFMPREDYDRLVALAPREFAKPVFFQCASTERLYPRGHAQVRYEGTAAVTRGTVDTPFDQSIFIDIFVYDALPKDKTAFIWRMMRAERLRSLMLHRVYGRMSLRNPAETLKVILSRVYFLFVPFRKAFARFDEQYRATGLEQSDDFSCPAFNAALVFKIIRRREWLRETIYMPFEDIMMPVPIGYDGVLRNQYGDYMTPVKTPTLHGSVIFDTERPYTEVIKDIRSGKISFGG